MTSAVYHGRKPINQYSFSFVDSQSARSSGTERGSGQRQKFYLLDIGHLVLFLE